MPLIRALAATAKINILALLVALGPACGSSLAATPAEVAVPILAYHRFGPVVADSMTVTDATFAWQLQYPKEHDYRVIPLSDLVDFLRGTGAAPPPRSVVMTADDGHRSVYSDMLPLVSQSGLEKVNLRIWRSGRYLAEMRVETADAALGEALASAGFVDAGGTRVLKIEGTL